MTEKINIRGIYFDDLSLDAATSVLGEQIENGNGIMAVYTPNAEIVQMCVEKNDYRELINSAEMIVPDGIGIIKAAKILGSPMKERIPGIELGEKMIEFCAKTGHKVYFLGGKPGVATLAAENMAKKYPMLCVSGTADGYFKKEGEENDRVIDDILSSGAELLFVCLGAPLQEKWIFDNKARLSASVKVCMALGGSLDVYSGTVKRAPVFFRKTGLEWFYRLLKQPSRIGRMMKLPKFLMGTYAEKIKRKS